MKAKTIKQVLAKKHADWLASIQDPELRIMLKQDTIITGGCIASMLLNEKVNDFDVYFRTRETVVAVAEYYVKQFKKARTEGSGMDLYEEDNHINIKVIEEDDRVKLRIKNRDLRPASEEGFQFSSDPDIEDYEDVETHLEDTSDVEKPKYRPVYLSANAITLSDKIQIVIRFYGDADSIHENYDFDHCTCFWESKNSRLTLPARALEALLTKELIYTGSKYPLASIIRTRKFINRGFTINAGQYLKMALQLNDLDLRHLPTLEDQLVGMDAVYFAKLIAAIPPEKRINDHIDTGYIMTMINRFF